MRSFLLSLFLFFGLHTFSQGFTIQNNFISVSGNSTDSDFYDNTYLDALSNTIITWSIIYDSVPQGWQYSICFPNCHPIGVTSGAINISQGNDYYLNGHFYPNNVAGEGMYVMEIDDGNGTIEQVTWHGIAGSGERSDPDPGHSAGIPCRSGAWPRPAVFSGIARLAGVRPAAGPAVG